jgi:hypothetical protein
LTLTIHTIANLARIGDRDFAGRMDSGEFQREAALMIVRYLALSTA